MNENRTQKIGQVGDHKVRIKQLGVQSLDELLGTCWD